MGYRDGETRPQRDHRIVKYVQEMIKDSVTTPDIKAKGHLYMAVTLSEDKVKESFPREAKGHFMAAYEEIEKAKAVYVSEKVDENLRKLKDELEKKEAHFRKREQEAKGEVAEEAEGRV